MDLGGGLPEGRPTPSPNSKPGFSLYTQVFAIKPFETNSHQKQVERKRRQTAVWGHCEAIRMGSTLLMQVMKVAKTNNSVLAAFAEQR